ncbi:cytochrome P450 alkane hydroxylase [Aspergillus ellipticus CBS 707.79]|uniref:Cytochrome P450 alkane hydroxylase n=1 Tax=Aspergillus ellipticus CBS 707.79 TaxID=1448320 RepID=A0A319D256_9EURO|nr:cytochrome P450 alkane hydroxylase [Aspergillus ellipticus CBS 707.79]
MDTSHHSVVVLASVILLLGYTLTYLQRKWTQRRIAKENNCQPLHTYPRKDPFFGLDNIYEQIWYAKRYKLLDRIAERFKEHGNTFQARRLATPFIIKCDPENIKTDYGLGNRIDAAGPLLGHGIFTTDGEHWAHSRAMIRPNFVKDQVAHLDIFEELMGDLLAMIPANGGTVDLQELFFEYTIDSATEFLFGHSVHSLKKRRVGIRDSTEQDFASAFNYAQKAIQTGLRLGKLRYFRPDPKAKECNRICHNLVEQFIDSALRVRERYDEEKSIAGRESHDEGRDKRKYLFLHGLAQQTGDRRRIRDELMNIWKKLRQEVAGLEGRAPSYEQLRNLTYLKYCLNESLRMHPVVPANGRYAHTDTILPVGGGPDGKSPVFVPKGCSVVYHVYAMHRREDFYYGPDADEFRPERWADLRSGWEYLPFNGGPRICVGQQYALTEAGYVTVRLAQRFSVLESRDPGPWEEALTLTLCSKNGTRVGLR